MFKGKRKNKKGSLQDVVFIMVVLLVFGMIVLFGYKVMFEVNSKIQSMSSDQVDTEGKTAFSDLTNEYTGAIDNSFLLLAIGLSIVALIFAALVRIHPIFIPFFFIFLVLVIFLSGIFSNIYQETAANSALATQADELTFTSLLLGKLPWLVMVIGILLMVVQYKTRDTIT